MIHVCATKVDNSSYVSYLNAKRSYFFNDNKRTSGITNKYNKLQIQKCFKMYFKEKKHEWYVN